MRAVSSWLLYGLIAAMLAVAAPLSAQQPDPFRWMDFHSQKDQDIVVWVTRSLEPEKWTAIREIGVQYDAALVVTTLRATPQSPANADTFTVWSVSLTTHAITLLLKGVNLRWLEWMRFADGAPLELGVLYDDCRDCAASTYFTAYYYDATRHTWAARWMRGAEAAPVWHASPPAGVNWTLVYGLLAEGDGHAELVTWTHLEYGGKKKPEEILFRYDIVPITHEDRTTILSLKEQPEMELRLCRGQDAVPGLERGQDSELCRQLMNPRPERKPVTTPPANNRGRSAPPASRH
jgi:hypothetical protein